MSGRAWAILLVDHPEYAEHCDWTKLNAHDCAYLLLKRPELADRCDWGKLDGDKWVYLLIARPELAEHCDWEKLDGDNWCLLLGNHPELAEHCDWEKINGRDLNELPARPKITRRKFSRRVPGKEAERHLIPPGSAVSVLQPPQRLFARLRVDVFELPQHMVIIEDACDIRVFHERAHEIGVPVRRDGLRIRDIAQRRQRRSSRGPVDPAAAEFFAKYVRLPLPQATKKS